MHQTWRFKRVNGTAYPDSIASSLRDASGAEVARLAESSNASEPMFAYEDREVPETRRGLDVLLRNGGVESDRGERERGCGHALRDYKWQISNLKSEM